MTTYIITNILVYEAEANNEEEALNQFRNNLLDPVDEDVLIVSEVYVSPDDVVHDTLNAALLRKHRKEEDQP